MRRLFQTLTYLLFGMAVLSPSLCLANGGGVRSYTSVGAPRMAYDPPTQFVGGFAQMYQAPAAVLAPAAPSPTVYTTQAPAQVICVPGQVYVQSQQPVRWVRIAR